MRPKSLVRRWGPCQWRATQLSVEESVRINQKAFGHNEAISLTVAAVVLELDNESVGCRSGGDENSKSGSEGLHGDDERRRSKGSTVGVSAGNGC